MASKDGWIRHRGGKCPVDDCSKVDVRYRNGEIHEDTYADDWSWNHTSDDDDIMAYRIIEEENQEMAVSELTIKVDTKDAIAAVDAEVARHVADHPFTWRDRIREIDAKQIALTNERAELVAKLAAEGLALCWEPVKAVAPVNLADPEKWEVGDIFEVIENSDDDHSFKVGELVRLTEQDAGSKEYHGTFEYLDGRDWWWCQAASVRWHSRP